jgi:replicative DNA helicase
VEDPLLDRIDYEELVLTAEFKRSTHVDLDTLWKDMSDPTIKAAPERFHRLLEHYSVIRLIDEKFCKRITDLTVNNLSPEDVLTHIQQDVAGVHATEQYTPATMRSLIGTMWDNRHVIANTTIKTGFSKLDGVIGALVPGCTYLWTARTSHGKSSWVAQIVNQQAINGHRVGVISLEDSRSVWASRWLSKVSGVSLGKIRDNVLTSGIEKKDGELKKDEVDAIEMSAQSSHLDNVFLTDAKGGRINDILRIMGDLCVRNGCEIIWVDYLQAIYAGPGNAMSRRDWLEYCWAMLEREADRLGVPLMLTAQLNRSWETEPLPTMPGLRHTEWLGAAEQKCYVGAVIYRPYKDMRVGEEEREDRFDELLVNIEKCKQGENVTIGYTFDPGACIIREA